MDDFETILEAAAKALAKKDPILGAHIARVGPCTVARARRFKPFEALAVSILHQQLNGKAAATIVNRVKAKVGKGRLPTPAQMARARVSTLRACGVSAAKALALKDLAVKTLDGTVPSARELQRLDDEAIVERVTQVRGIGRWTVQMMLMFRLGRLDVMPVDDFGVRKGHALLYGHPEHFKPKALLAASEVWKPYRSVAAWYFWRVLDT